MMEFSRALNENGFLYVPYAEVKQQEEKLKQELETYKKALHMACDILCVIMGGEIEVWEDKLLQKAREE